MMTKINIEVEIFNNAEYCHNDDFGASCKFLIHGHCMLRDADKETGTAYVDRFKKLEFENESGSYVKCQECKKAYQKAQIKFGCFIDYDGIAPLPDCVVDTNSILDCIEATEGMKKEDCEFWRKIK